MNKIYFFFGNKRKETANKGKAEKEIENSKTKASGQAEGSPEERKPQPHLHQALDSSPAEDSQRSVAAHCWLLQAWQDGLHSDSLHEGHEPDQPAKTSPVNHMDDERVEAIPHSTATPNWTVHVSDIRTVKVNNISLITSKKDIEEFFSFSGDIQYIEMQRETDRTQVAYVTFKNSQGAETAVLLTGSKISDLYVTITPVEKYQLPPDALPSSPTNQSAAAVKKAEDVISTMLAKGFILGKDAINKTRAFDERHHLTSNASSTVASIDRRMGISDKLSIGTTIVNEKVREMDERFQLSEMTKSAIAVAEQKASSAGSVIMSNPYVLTGASWMSSAFSAIAKAAEDVSMKTKEKVEQAEVEKKEIVDGFSQMHFEESSDRGPAVVPINSDNDSKPGNYIT